MPVLERDGVQLVYTDHGRPERPAMVLIHGWCDRSATMGPLAEAFTASHRVVRVDLRGHGGSDAPLDEANYAITTLAEDLAALCEHLGVWAAVLVGHSLGGAVAVELAARRPELVAAVVALEGTILFPDEAAPAVRPWLTCCARRPGEKS
jgi:pimeloyl-ACP methyl ester carboxylesterase